MNSYIGLGLSGGILVLFFIIVIIGYIYIAETRENIASNQQNINLMNTTLHQIIKQLERKQIVDTIKFDKELDGLQKSLDIVISNQMQIINLTKQKLKP